MVENSLFCWVSGIIGTSKKKGDPSYAAVRNGSAPAASKRDNRIPAPASGKPAAYDRADGQKPQGADRTAEPDDRELERNGRVSEEKTVFVVQ